MAAPPLLWPELTTDKLRVFLRTQKEVSVGADRPQPMEGLQAILVQFSQTSASPTQTDWAVATEVHSFLFIKIALAKARYPGQNKQTLTEQHTNALVSACSL